MTEQSLFFHIIGSRLFQILAMIVTGIYLTILFVTLNDEYCESEAMVNVLPITKKMEQFATPVMIGLHVNNFLQFSFDKNEFVLDGVVWFKFPIGTESLETVQRFSMENSWLQNSGTILYKSEPTIKQIDTDVIVAFDIQASFKSPLNYQKFPIGDHKLNIIITHKYSSPYELSLVSDPASFSLSENLMISNWRCRQLFVKTGYKESSLYAPDKRLVQSYPVAVFSIDFENIGYQELMSLYFPMFVIFFIGLFSLVISVRDARERLVFIGSSVPILVLFRMVIDSVSPPGVGYNTHVDKVFYLLVFISLCVLLFQTYVTASTRYLADHTAAQQEKILRRLIRENSIVLLLSLLAVLAYMSYSAFYL